MKILTILNTILLGVVLLLILREKPQGVVSQGISQFQLDSSISVVTARVQELSRSSLDSSTAAEIAAIRAQLRVLGTNLRNLRGITIAQLESQGPIGGTLVPLDTNKNFTNEPNWDSIVRGMTQEYQWNLENDNLSASGTSNILTGESQGNYRYWANLIFLPMEKKRFLRPSLKWVDIAIDDPNATLGVSSYEMTPPRNLFDISFQLGYGWGINGKSVERFPYAGIGISKKIFSINLKSAK